MQFVAALPGKTQGTLRENDIGKVRSDLCPVAAHDAPWTEPNRRWRTRPGSPLGRRRRSWTNLGTGAWRRSAATWRRPSTGPISVQAMSMMWLPMSWAKAPPPDTSPSRSARRRGACGRPHSPERSVPPNWSTSPSSPFAISCRANRCWEDAAGREKLTRPTLPDCCQASSTPLCVLEPCRERFFAEDVLAVCESLERVAGAAVVRRDDDMMSCRPRPSLSDGSSVCSRQPHRSAPALAAWASMSAIRTSSIAGRRDEAAGRCCAAQGCAVSPCNLNRLCQSGCVPSVPYRNGISMDATAAVDGYR